MSKIIIGETEGFQVMDLVVWGGVNLFIFVLGLIGIVKSLSGENTSYAGAALIVVVMLIFFGITYMRFRRFADAIEKQK